MDVVNTLPENSGATEQALVPIDRPLPEPGIVVAAEQPCFVCFHPECKAIENHYVKRGRHVARTARKFGIIAEVLSQHLPKHLPSAQKRKQAIQTRDPEATLRLRIRERAATLFQYLQKAGTANEFDNVAKLAEVLRRYDEMLLKLQGAPGFRQNTAPRGPARGGTTVDAPGAKFMFVTQNPPAALEAPDPDDSPS